MAATPTRTLSRDDARLVRVLRDMNSVLTTAEDWEERVGCVLSELDNLLTMDLAAVLLAGSKNQFLVYLDSPLDPDLVETIKANVADHYRLISQQPVETDAFSTTFLGLQTPKIPLSKGSNGKGRFGKGSYLSLPMLGVDEIVGVIHVFSVKSSSYDEEDLNLFSLVAAKLGSYLAHVNRHQLMEEYDQERDAFMAEVLHELRNPLTSATGFTQLLLRQLAASEAPDRAKEINMLERVLHQLRRVVQMADSVVDVTRIRAGWMAIERERVDLGKLARRVIEAVEVTTDSHTIALETAGGCVVWGDEGRLEQVFRNLLSNAVKFSPVGGRIEISTRLDDDAKGVTVAVKDHGMGIPPEQRDHLFERYYRSDAATQRRIGGSGLGLYISSEIIRRHGGRINVESEVGRGSTFSFTLPTAKGFS